MDLGELNLELEAAVRNARPIPQLTKRYPQLTLTEAYKIQNIGLEAALKHGGKCVGYKMGLTSRAKQQDVGVKEPIRGYLLQSHALHKGQALNVKGRIHPRVEPELALICRERISTKTSTVSELLKRVAVVPAVEVVDSRYQDFQFNLNDVVADNTSASGFYVGASDMSQKDYRLSGVVVKKNGSIVQTGCAAAVLGEPLLSGLALVEALAQEGKALEAGMVVLTGGMTASVPVAAGDFMEFQWAEETLSFQVI